MRRRARRFAVIGIISIGLALLTLFGGIWILVGQFSELGNLRAAESTQAQSEAAGFAHALDGYIRIAENALTAVDLQLEASAAAQSDAVLKEAAFRIPEASNAYLFDARARVIAAAWADRVAAPHITAAELAEVARQGGYAVSVEDSPHGPLLAVITSLETKRGAEYAAVAFENVFFDARSGLGEDGRNSTAILVDQSGRQIVEGRKRLPPVSQSVSAETTLPTHQVKLRIVRDLGPRTLELRSRIGNVALIITTILVALGAVSVMAGVTSRKAREAVKLHEDLEARDRLFHEVNHRIKNNLTTIQAILRFGELEIEDRPERAAAVMRAAADRVESIGKLHEQLYSNRSLVDVDLGRYLEELAASLRDTYGHDRRIALDVVAEPRIAASLEVGVPVALIVTELVTNAYKYAFPGGLAGTIRVGLSRLPEGGLLLEVADDGVGSGGESSHGFGTTLVRGLAGQMLAEIESSAGDGGGTRWRIRIPPAKTAVSA